MQSYGRHGQSTSVSRVVKRCGCWPAGGCNSIRQFDQARLAAEFHACGDVFTVWLLLFTISLSATPSRHVLTPFALRGWYKATAKCSLPRF
jgi:hypothetical protein